MTIPASVTAPLLRPTSCAFSMSEGTFGGNIAMTARCMTYLIIGAGTAGCVLAARLSEDTSVSVCVIEAGPDYPTLESLPPKIRDGLPDICGHHSRRPIGFHGQPKR